MTSPALHQMALRATERVERVRYWRGILVNRQEKLDALEMSVDYSTGAFEEYAAEADQAAYELRLLGAI